MTEFLNDTFSGETALVSLQDHIGEVGATWAKYTGSTFDILIPGPNTYTYITSAGGGNIYRASGAPANANYSVTAGMFFSHAVYTGKAFGPIARCATDFLTFYWVRYNVDRWQLCKQGSSFVILDELIEAWPAALGVVYPVTLSVIGNRQTVQLGTRENALEAFDTEITGAGFAGLRYTATSSVDVNRARIDYITATDATDEPPTAVIDPSTTVPNLNETVTLDSSGSTDSDGTIVSRAWEFITKPIGSSATISGADQVEASFTPDRSGLYVVKLTITDSGSNVSTTFERLWCEVTYLIATSNAPIVSDGDDFLVGGTAGRFNVIFHNNKYYAWYFEEHDPIWEIHCIEFDPATGTIAGPYVLGSSKSNDAHNAANVVVDSQGYFHAFYGAHHAALYYKKSTNPNSIATWGTEEQPSGANPATYPTAFITADDEPLAIFRGSGGGDYQDALKMTKKSGGSFTTTTIVDDNDVDHRLYPTGVQKNGVIYVMWTIRDSDLNSSASYRDAQYMESHDYGVTWLESDGVTSYSLPINSDTTAEKIVTGSNNYVRGSLVIDSAGTLYAGLFYDGPLDQGMVDAKFDLLKKTGTTWSRHVVRSVADIGTLNPKFIDGQDIVLLAHMKDTYYEANRFISSDGGETWAGPEKMTYSSTASQWASIGNCGYAGLVPFAIWSSGSDVVVYAEEFIAPEPVILTGVDTEALAVSSPGTAAANKSIIMTGSEAVCLSVSSPGTVTVGSSSSQVKTGSSTIAENESYPGTIIIGIITRGPPSESLNEASAGTINIGKALMGIASVAIAVACGGTASTGTVLVKPILKPSTNRITTVYSTLKIS